MRTILFLTLILLLPRVFSAQPQQPSQPVLNSHEIHPDRTVTFRYKDAAAAQVRLVLEGTLHPLAMHRDPEGVWSITTPSLPPELYRYSFQVDGKNHSDPDNPRTTTGLSSLSSVIHVHGDTPEPWDTTNVPHGVLHNHTYTSHIVLGLPGDQSDYIVYTPPGYDARQHAHHHYPVLYLLHGWSDLADGWITIGQANLIFDNLIAERRMVPMVVVMPLGYGDMAFVHNGHKVWDDPAKVQHNLALFTQALLTEVRPQVEADYDVSRKREDRAIAGLSMGGFEALSIGLTHPNLFAWVAGMSAAFHDTTYTEQLSTLTPKQAHLRLLWIACGIQDRLLPPNRRFVAFLQSRGMPVTLLENPGMHTWLTWRENLIELAPLLFRKH
jgi:enterochelin esterase-like enzyme